MKMNDEGFTHTRQEMFDTLSMGLNDYESHEETHSIARAGMAALMRMDAMQEWITKVCAALKKDQERCKKCNGEAFHGIRNGDLVCDTCHTYTDPGEPEEVEKNIFYFNPFVEEAYRKRLL